MSDDGDTLSPVRQRGFSIKQTSVITGLSHASVARGVADGTIPSTKYKDRRIISDATIAKLIAPVVVS